jgi:hypothetical protein
MTLAGPGPVETDMTWMYSVPEAARLAAGAALAAEMPTVAAVAAAVAVAARMNVTGLRMMVPFSLSWCGHRRRR